jgi:hypothetical protein
MRVPQGSQSRAKERKKKEGLFSTSTTWHHLSVEEAFRKEAAPRSKAYREL